MQKIEFYKHNISEQDKKQVLEVLDSLFLTTGDVVSGFEKKFAVYLGARFAVGVMSCTHALELALRYYGIGPGDEVITTPMSFIATANAIEILGARPVFVDIEETTGNINADLIENVVTNKTKAILPVHLYGQMCDMVKIRKIANRYNLKIIEDCAHCIEGMRGGIRPGQLGDIACFSFYTTKNLTCGEGGALVCNDEKIYDWMCQARQHGMSKGAIDRFKKYQHYEMEFLGLKCNMSNIQAALLINQLDNLEYFWNIRNEIVLLYNDGLKENDFISRLKIQPNSKHAYHLYTILINQKMRDKYLEKLQKSGVGCSVHYRPIHLMKYYRNKYSYKEESFPVAEKIGFSTISLPLYPKLKNEEVIHIVQKVNEVIDETIKRQTGEIGFQKAV